VLSHIDVQLPCVYKSTYT